MDVYFLTSRHPCLGLACTCLSLSWFSAAVCFTLPGNEADVHVQCGDPTAQLNAVCCPTAYHIKPFRLNRARHMHTYIYFPPLLAIPTRRALLFALLLHISQYTAPPVYREGRILRYTGLVSRLLCAQPLHLTTDIICSQPDDITCPYSNHDWPLNINIHFSYRSTQPLPIAYLCFGGLYISFTKFRKLSN